MILCNTLRLAGHRVYDALLEACPLRLRPILMTSHAIMAVAIPQRHQLGPRCGIARPHGHVVIGGPLLSILLPLPSDPFARSKNGDSGQPRAKR